MEIAVETMAARRRPVAGGAAALGASTYLVAPGDVITTEPGFMRCVEGFSGTFFAALAMWLFA